MLWAGMSFSGGDVSGDFVLKGVMSLVMFSGVMSQRMFTRSDVSGDVLKGGCSQGGCPQGLMSQGMS